MPQPTPPRRRHTNPARLVAEIYAAYLRVSSHEQLMGYGLDAQDSALDRWFSDNPGRILFDKYRDEGVSGELDARPEKSRLEGDADRGLFNRIVVPKVDRIGRTARASYNWAWQMSDMDIHFVSISENIDTSTPYGWQAFQQYVQFSEMEWNRIRERTIGGREMKVAKGGWPAGPPPYGYEIVGQGKKGSYLQINRYEAFVLHTAVSLLVDDKMSFPKAAAELNRRRLLPRSGRPWSGQNLYQRLHADPILKGYTIYRKTNRGDRKKNTALYTDGTPVHGPSHTIELDPIFEKDRIDDLLGAFTRTARHRQAQENRFYSLTGRIRGGCGSTYAGGGRISERAYRCGGKSSETTPCDCTNLDADEVEERVWNEVCKLLADQNRLDELAAQRLQSLPGNRDKYLERKTSLTSDIERQEAKIKDTVPQYIKAGMDPEVAAAAVKQLQEEISRWESQLEEVDRWLKENEIARSRADEIAALSRKSQENLRLMSNERKAEIFEMLKISVTPLDHRFMKQSGARCKVTDWHRKTGRMVPDDVTVEQWVTVEAMIRERHGSRHLSMAEIDLHKALNTMLGRLRTGAQWTQLADSPEERERLRQRQGVWFRSGTWQALVDHLEAFSEGTPVFHQPKTPAFLVVGQLYPELWSVFETKSGELTELTAEEAGFTNPLSGMLRELAVDAEKIARSGAK